MVASDPCLTGAGILGDELVVFWSLVDGLRADQPDNSRQGTGGAPGDDRRVTGIVTVAECRRCCPGSVNRGVRGDRGIASTVGFRSDG